MTENSVQPLWSVADVAQFLGQTTVHIRDKFRKGDYPRSVAFKPPTSERIYFHPDRFQAWIEGRLDDDSVAIAG